MQPWLTPVDVRPTPMRRGSAASFDLRRSRARGIRARPREADARDDPHRCSSRALSARSVGSTPSSAAPRRERGVARARSDASRPAWAEVSQQDQSRPVRVAFASMGSRARCVRRAAGSVTATPSSPDPALVASQPSASGARALHAAALRCGAAAAEHRAALAAGVLPSSEAARGPASAAARDERRSAPRGRPGPPGPSCPFCPSSPRLNCVRWGLARGEARKKGGPRWPKAA
jgi:hypothetical protein